MREIETKFDVPPDFRTPDVDGFVPAGGRLDVDTVTLASTYWDTSALTLLRYRLTLRRRVGDTDSGWQLKVPGASFRTELRWPSDAGSAAGSEPPAEMLELLHPFLGRATPAPAVRLTVTRTRHRIVDASGTLVVELAHDDVRAASLASEVRAARWHEVEAELGPAGDRTLLAEVGVALLQAGAFASTSRSKLARSLLGIGNEGIGTPRTSAGAVLADYIEAQSDALTAAHFGISEDAPDSIHQGRVAARRLRSTLRNFEHCFDEDQAVALEAELKWYAEVLGEVRDREVLRARLAEAISGLSDALVVGPVADRIDARLAAEQAEKRADVLELMRGQRYADLLADVIRWRDDPPFTAAAGRPAQTLLQAVDRAERKLGKRLSDAVEPSGTDEQLHSARKAGKRARYAAEAATGDNSKAVRAAKALQDLLGEFQDSVVAEAVLRRLADDAWSRGENNFTYGVLVAEERGRADEARVQARSEASRLNRTKN